MHTITKDSFSVLAEFLSVKDLGRLAQAFKHSQLLVYKSNTWKYRFFSDLSSPTRTTTPKIQLPNARDNYHVFCKKRNEIMADSANSYDLLDILEDRWEMHAVMGDWDSLKAELAKFPEMPKSQYEDITPFGLAIMGGHDKLVAELLDYYSLTLESKLPNMTEIITTCCKLGRLNTLKRLYKAGVDLNLPKDDPPILIAAMFGHTHLVQQLTDWGYDVTVTDNAQCSVLHYLAEYGNTELFWRLAKNPALDTEAENINGITPAYYAAKGGFVDLFEQLSTGSEERYRILDAAIANKKHDFIDWYIRQQNIDIHDPATSAKHIAAQAGDWDSYIKYAENCEVTEKDDLGNTVAHYAAELEDVTFLSKLVDHYGQHVLELRSSNDESVLEHAESVYNDAAASWIKQKLSPVIAVSK